MNIIEQIKVNDVSIDGYQGTYYADNTEYVRVTTDSEGKILEGIKSDGTKHITGNLIVDGSIYNDSLDVDGIVEEIQERIDEVLEFADYLYTTESNEYYDILLDSENKLINAITKDGEAILSGINVNRLAKKVENQEELIKEISNGNINALSVYKDEVDEIRRKFRQNIDSDTFSFMFIADSHHQDPPIGDCLNAATVAKELSELLGVDAIIHAGDMITQKEPYETENVRLLEEYMSRFRTYIPFLYAIGHHEMMDYHFDTDTWSLDYKTLLGQTGRFSRYIKQNFDVNNYANFYIDVYNSNLRFIFVDSLYKKWGFTDATIAWIQSVLNISNGKKLCFFSHVPFLTRATYYPQESWATVVNGDELHTVLKDYVDSGGDILAWFHGHTHVDNIVKDDDMYFPLISTACALCSQYNGTGWPIAGNPTAPERTDGTYSQYCMDIVNIHPNTNTINMYRFGAGEDRIINL